MNRVLLVLLATYHLQAAALDTRVVLGLLHEGDFFLAADNFSMALESCRKGLKVLGYEYVSPNLEDDTDMKLIAAMLQEKEGKFNNAAAVTCGILRERIRLFETKNDLGAKNPNQTFQPTPPARLN